MESYEKLGPIGEGTYGTVIKCRHKDTGQIVAIKKFKESEEDMQIRKTALREVRMLKQLRHSNIVNLIDAFKRKGKLYLVFEHLDHTILEDLDKSPNGLPYDQVRKYMFQLLKAMDYLHDHNVIHRDIKPENILASKVGILKLCDFGFARTLAGQGAKYTDYVATRWYRAPELLVGDVEYGKPVDIWAIGCIFAELMTGQPLYPGDSDIDQLFKIMKTQGKLTRHFTEVFMKNPLFVGVRIPEIARVEPLEEKLPTLTSICMKFLKACLVYEPEKRASCKDLFKHEMFHHDNFAAKYEQELFKLCEEENVERMRLMKLKKDSEEGKSNESLTEDDPKQQAAGIAASPSNGIVSTAPSALSDLKVAPAALAPPALAKVPSTGVVQVAAAAIAPIPAKAA